jgi:RimJ/RimL family protein N-acetyltransferase
MEHLVELARVLRDETVYAHIGGAVPSEALFVEGLRRALAGPPVERTGEYWLNYLIRLAETGRMIGRLEATVVGDRAEVAFLVSPECWGRGIGAAALAWLEEALVEAHGVGSFWATTVPANVRCRRLLESTGYGPVDPAAAPVLHSYDPGDLVYRKAAPARHAG